jgi:hypothetical protein
MKRELKKSLLGMKEINVNIFVYSSFKLFCQKSVFWSTKKLLSCFGNHIFFYYVHLKV